MYQLAVATFENAMRAEDARLRSDLETILDELRVRQSFPEG